MSWRISEAARILAARLDGGDGYFQGASIDSRTVQPGELFVAVPGQRVDGHDFIDQAADRGAAAALVSRAVHAPIPTLQVADVVDSLGRLAAAWRARHGVRVIAVTGSNGKTTTRNMIAAILANRPTLVTTGNLNNELGLPLTLLQLDQTHRYAVLELGAGGPGDIAHLAGIAQPDVALITNAGAAHLDRFGSVGEVARGKGEIYGCLREDGVGVVNFDDHHGALWLGMLKEHRVLGFSLHPNSDEQVRVFARQADPLSGELVLQIDQQQCSLQLPVSGWHNLANAVAAAAASHAAGVDVEQIAAGLSQFRPEPGRLQRQTLASGVLIDDSYNANPGSVRAAIDYLSLCPAGSRWLVLGDMRALGNESPARHAEIGRYALTRGIDRLFLLGEATAAAAEGFGEQAERFDSHQALIDALMTDWHDDVYCLVKGSRAMAMERVSNALREQLEKGD